jgi:hypothetical protein
LNKELGDRAPLIVITVTWSELVDFDWNRLKDFLGVKTERDDRADRDAVVCVSLDTRSSGGSAGRGEDSRENGRGMHFA